MTYDRVLGEFGSEAAQNRRSYQRFVEAASGPAAVALRACGGRSRLGFG